MRPHTLALIGMVLATLACAKPRVCTIYSTDVECHVIASDNVRGTVAHERAYASARYEQYRRAHLRAQSFYLATYSPAEAGLIHDAHPAMLRFEIEQLHRALDELARFEPHETVPPQGEIDPDIILEPAALRSALAAELFVLEVRRAPWRDPTHYLEDLRLEPFLVESTPLEQRVAALIRMAEGAASHLEHARANLEPELEQALLTAALAQVRAMLETIESELPEAVAGLDQQRRTELEAALAELSEALREFEAFLAERSADRS